MYYLDKPRPQYTIYTTPHKFSMGVTKFAYVAQMISVYNKKHDVSPRVMSCVVYVTISIFIG